MTAFTTILSGVILTLSIALGLGGKDLAKQWLENQFQKKEQNQKGVRSHW